MSGATLDLTPRPGAAPLPRMVAAQARMESRLLLRNGEQILLALVIPLLVLVAGTESGDVVDLGTGSRIDILAPGVLALAILSTSFTSLAIATGFERRYEVLKLLGSTPLPRAGLLAGKTAAVLVVEAIQLVVLGGAALLLGWEPSGGVLAIAWLVLVVLLGTAAFGALGLLVAGVLRAEATLAAANLIYVLLLLGGAIVVPLGRYPDSAQPFLELLPSAALSEAIRAVTAGGGPGAEPLVVLVAWALLAGFAVAKTFRWE
ncbi:ABC transporter permease [Solicola gregarius]|uniref:Transport permease protein n=1 Tax=Solicola gregarius TaxID=2908642 RepID=A0AA46YK00_9ACTN|nr:ABC transporter permease [Solicola gregarius]UYM04917.1 ABC transporter permease [Solicola gregarius]